MRTLSEAVGISSADRALLGTVKTAIARALPECEVCLYGSVARGDNTAESDYDILVLTDQATSSFEQSLVRGALYQIELERGVIFSTVFRARSVWDSPLMQASPFHEEVLKDGIVL